MHNYSGGKNNQHIGNEKFRELARAQAYRYNGASKKEKGIIARDLVVAVRSLKPPGRFLKRTSTTSHCWLDVGDELAREKASQVLRDAVALVCEPEEEEEGKEAVHRHAIKMKKTAKAMTLDSSIKRPRRVSQEPSNGRNDRDTARTVSEGKGTKKRHANNDIDAALEAAASIPPAPPVPTLTRILSGPCKKRRVSNFFEKYAYQAEPIDISADKKGSSDVEPPMLLPVMSSHSASLLAPLLKRGDSMLTVTPDVANPTTLKRTDSSVVTPVALSKLETPDSSLLAVGPPKKLQRRQSSSSRCEVSGPPKLDSTESTGTADLLDSLGPVGNSSGHSFAQFVNNLDTIVVDDKDDGLDEEFYSDFC